MSREHVEKLAARGPCSIMIYALMAIRVKPSQDYSNILLFDRVCSLEDHFQAFARWSRKITIAD